MLKSKFEQYIDRIAELEVVVVSLDGLPIGELEVLQSNTLICLNSKGKVHIQYDDSEGDFNINDVAIILPGHKVRVISYTDDYSAKLIIVSNLLDDELKARRIRHRHGGYHLQPAYHLDEVSFKQVSVIIDAIEMVADFSAGNTFDRHEALLNLLDVLVDMLRSFRTSDTIKSDYATNKGYEIFNQFCDLLAQYYNTQHETQFYAEKLFMTPKYFSQVIRDTTGVSASHWIVDYIISKAKRMLVTRPDLSVQNIGYLLGFKEQAGFSRFFKNNVGISPKQFRNHK